MVAPNESRLTQVATPRRYGERINSGSAAKAPPPTRSRRGSTSVGAFATRSMRWTQNTAASRKAAAAINRLTGPSGADSKIVTTGPRSAPAVPPAPMNPNSRLPCSAVNRSAMNDQNTATANKLNTLTQTKNTRATITFSTSKVSNTQNRTRLATKKW